MPEKDTGGVAAASPAPASSAPVPFKKRARRGKKGKRVIRKSAAAKDVESDDDDLNTVLSDVVAEQRARARAKGVAAKYV